MSKHHQTILRMLETGWCLQGCLLFQKEETTIESAQDVQTQTTSIVPCLEKAEHAVLINANAVRSEHQFWHRSLWTASQTASVAVEVGYQGSTLEVSLAGRVAIVVGLVEGAAADLAMRKRAGDS